MQENIKAHPSGIFKTTIWNLSEIDKKVGKRLLLYWKLENLENRTTPDLTNQG